MSIYIMCRKNTKMLCYRLKDGTVYFPDGTLYNIYKNKLRLKQTNINYNDILNKIIKVNYYDGFNFYETT